MTHDKSREAFETWYLSQNPFNTIDKTPSGLKSDDIYCKPATRRAWAAWQAALSSQQSADAWRPVETAPRDAEQTCILAWAETRDGGCPHLHGVYIVFWDDIQNAWLIASSMRKIENECWHLTKWQPLPTPPADSKGV